MKSKCGESAFGQKLAGFSSYSTLNTALPYKDGQVKRRRARTREVCECVDHPGVNGILELGWPEPRVLQEVSEQRLFLVGYEGHEISRE